ncbi:MAG: holo-ACP synthase [Proteobacteria bacterium]|nr:holo-ACP synthase [Pseudomonadota bacterium]
MILGIGTDLISVSRIQNLIFKFKEKFEEKIFTENEINKAQKIKIGDEISSPRAAFYAKRFAAKEAFSKALGLGIGRGVNFKDIEIDNSILGKPTILILNQKEEFIKNHFNCKNFLVHLSLSDENSLASAFVVIEKIS